MSIASWADDAAKYIGQAIGDIVSSRTIPEAINKGYDKIVRPVGKGLFNFGLKGASKGVETTADTIEHFRKHGDTYKKIGKGILNVGKEVGSGFAYEASEIAQAGVNAVAGTGKLLQKLKIIEPTTLDKSLIGWKFTKRGKAALTAGALLMGTGPAAKDYATSRTGRNDGQLHRVTPTISNPYEISQQMVYNSSMGHSYADNAGATGDLVFALDNLNK